MINYIDLGRLDSIPDISLDLNNPPSYVTSFNPILSDSAEIEMECEIDGDALAKIIGDDVTCGKTFTLEYEGMISVQIKKHRKKRIDKKWAKRYGYKMVPKHIRMVDCIPNQVAESIVMYSLKGEENDN